MSNLSPLATLCSSFAQQRLLVRLEGSEVDTPVTALPYVERLLRAAAATGVADVTVECARRDPDVVHIRIRLRAIDRSVAIAFAEKADIAQLRVQLAENGAELLEAHTRFAIFHLVMAFAVA